MQTEEKQAAPSLPPPPSVTKKRRRWVPVLGMIVLIGAIAGGALVFGAAGETRLEAAFEEANLEQSQWFELADEGSTIIIDGPMTPDVESAIEFDQPLPTEQELDDIIAFWNQLDRFCKAVEVPTYIQSQIETTNSLAGEQTATFDGLEASWSFHPDSGLDMTIHEEE